MAEPDYKELYLKMVRASEKAIRILIEAQQKCEELYLASEDGIPAAEVQNYDEKQGSSF